MTIIKPILIICCFLLLVNSGFGQNTVPVIDTVRVEQRINTKKVDIYYEVLDFDNDNLFVLVKISDDGGNTFNIPAHTFSGDYGLGIVPGNDIESVEFTQDAAIVQANDNMGHHAHGGGAQGPQGFFEIID